MLVELNEEAPVPVHACVEYVPLPPDGVAVRFSPAPAQIAGATGLIVAEGLGFTNVDVDEVAMEAVQPEVLV